LSARDEQLRKAFPEGLQSGALLAPFTAARIGGPAEYLLAVRSAAELEAAARKLWSLSIEFRVLGGGSNVLIADAGVRGVVVLNQAREVRFEAGDPPRAWAESGASLGGLARRAAAHNLSGLEWAATVPGSVGGAIVGNAGAHGGDIAGTLSAAELIGRGGERRAWTAAELEFGYRTSWLKRHPSEAVVLSGEFGLELSDEATVREKMAEFNAYRQATQPGGASIGSMFVNPPDDAAGRLIEAAGLKGERRGAIEISTRHANFFVNRGGGRAADVCALIELARRRVAEKFGVRLELEIELVGNWEADA
jgi:UDP-N-acetylmuramate dehydrogenase